MKLLVTGTDGYLGCLLAPYLAARGHEVIGVDTGFYRAGWLFNGLAELPRTISKDIRNLDEDDLAGVDAVVHLAELSNDPLGQLAPEVTFDINHRGSVRLAELAKRVGVPRFVYTSVVQRLRRRHRRGRHRGVAHPPADGLRRVQDAGRAGRGRPGRRRLLPHLPAQRHRLRRLAPHALRHRAQQPGRRGLDHRARSR